VHLLLQLHKWDYRHQFNKTLMAKHQIMKISQEVFIYKINQLTGVGDLLRVGAPT
jgi:hypothetical protein